MVFYPIRYAHGSIHKSKYIYIYFTLHVSQRDSSNNINVSYTCCAARLTKTKHFCNVSYIPQTDPPAFPGVENGLE